MKTFLIICATLFLLSTQNSFGQLIDHPKPSLILQISQTSGTNGASVAYNPDKRLYYAVIAGNGAYPLEVFDGNGNNVYQTDAGVDTRGIWWNPKTKTLEGNGYGDVGIFSYSMNSSGFPSEGTQTVFPGENHQACEQCVGTFDTKKKAMMYYASGYITWYSRSKGVEIKKMALEVGSGIDDINEYSTIYTGVKNMEIGLLDYNNNKVYLYSAKTGKRTGTVELPSNAETHGVFRFAYANKHVFLYSVDSRSWTGYKIFA